MVGLSPTIKQPSSYGIASPRTFSPSFRPQDPALSGGRPPAVEQDRAAVARKTVAAMANSSPFMKLPGSTLAAPIKPQTPRGGTTVSRNDFVFLTHSNISHQSLI
jgi:hypothetical protein